MFGAWLRRLLRIDDDLGRRGERFAAQYLARLGYRVLQRGRRFRFGELDLIALDGRTVVFVEVKTRRGDRRGRPAEAVDGRKQARITRAALAYLKSHGLLANRVRFDVVALVWPEAVAEPEVTHIRSAFEAGGPRGMFT